jgi:hypothetical protein
MEVTWLVHNSSLEPERAPECMYHDGVSEMGWKEKTGQSGEEIRKVVYRNSEGEEETGTKPKELKTRDL